MAYAIDYEVSWLDASKTRQTNVGFDDRKAALRYAFDLHRDYRAVGAVLLTQTITIPERSSHVATWSIRCGEPAELLRGM
jgi:hypothetical protein